jgi:hypothetical protein
MDYVMFTVLAVCQVSRRADALRDMYL